MSEPKRPKPKNPAAAVMAKPPVNKALAPKEVNVLPEHLRSSRERIYETMMRGGGESFGRPFSGGIASLTQSVLKRIKQKGFFSFETFDAPNRDGDLSEQGRNKFTRYGAAPFLGDHAARKRKPS